MNNITNVKELGKQVRKELKQLFPKCKFSVTTTHNQITVALMAAPFEVLNTDQGHRQLNFLFDKSYEDYTRWNNNAVLTQEGYEVMQKVEEISNRDNWDESDAMTDYFHRNYYFRAHIGKWNKPFIQVS